MNVTENLIPFRVMACELGVCEQSVRNYVRKGQLDEPDCRIGKKVFWTREAATKAQQRLMNRHK